MTYKIPGTEDLFIDKHFTITGSTPVVIHDDSVDLMFFGKKKTLTKLFLLGIAKYRYTRLDDINRVIVTEQMGKRNTIKPFLFFKKPILDTIDNNFRVCPMDPSIVVSKDGICRDRESGELLKITKYRNVKQNKGWYCYLQKNGKNIGIHRLVASAWIVNDNPFRYSIVNHLDNDGTNNSMGNLEWTDYSGNNRHRVRWGPSDVAIPITLRDVFTDEIKKFASIRDTRAFLQMTDSNVEMYRNAALSHRLFHGRWEISLDEEPSWFYDTNPVLIGSFRRPQTILVVKIKDRPKCYCSHMLKTSYYFGLFNLEHNTADCVVKVLKARYLVESLEVIKTPPLFKYRKEVSVDRTIEITDKVTGKTQRVKSLRDGSRLYNVGRDYLTRMMRAPREDDPYIVKKL